MGSLLHAFVFPYATHLLFTCSSSLAQCTSVIHTHPTGSILSRITFSSWPVKLSGAISAYNCILSLCSCGQVPFFINISKFSPLYTATFPLLHCFSVSLSTSIENQYCSLIYNLYDCDTCDQNHDFITYTSGNVRNTNSISLRKTHALKSARSHSSHNVQASINGGGPPPLLCTQA